MTPVITMLSTSGSSSSRTSPARTTTNARTENGQPYQPLSAPPAAHASKSGYANSDLLVGPAPPDTRAAGGPNTPVPNLPEPSAPPFRPTVTLLTAAEMGNLETCRQFLAGGADVNSWKAKIPLHKAVEGDHLEVVELLLEHKADVNAKDRVNRTALGVAAERLEGDSETKKKVAQLLLVHHANILTHGYLRQTALQMAAFQGNTSILEVLVEHARDKIEDAPRGSTPLQLAAKRGHVDAVKLLLNAHANPNTQDNRGKTALALALEHLKNEVVATYCHGPQGLPNVITSLLQAGSDPTIKDEDGKSSEDFAIRAKTIPRRLRLSRGEILKELYNNVIDAGNAKRKVALDDCTMTLPTDLADLIAEFAGWKTSSTPTPAAQEKPA